MPDIAAIANPDTGIWVYSQSPMCGGWCVYGGTSVASPLVASIFNHGGYSWSTSFNALSNIYSLGGSGQISVHLTDINNGVCGPGGNSVYPAYEGFDPQWIKATTGIPWSYCAGWGAPKDTGNPDFTLGSTK